MPAEYIAILMFGSMLTLMLTGQRMFGVMQHRAAGHNTKHCPAAASVRAGAPRAHDTKPHHCARPC